MNSIPRTLGSRSIFPYVFGGLFLLVLADSWRRAEVDPGIFFEAEGREHLWRFVTGMYPPDLSWDFLELMIRPTLETIQISVMGTLIAVLIGFPLGLLATSTFSFQGILHESEYRGFGPRHALKVCLYGLARGLLSLFRCIPEFVWAFMFVRAVGLGPFPGVLAIGVAYGGMLGKVYSEIFESVNERPLEAIQSTGAGRLQIFFYGWFPQVLPNITSYTLYRWGVRGAHLGHPGPGGRRRHRPADRDLHPDVQLPRGDDLADHSVLASGGGGLRQRQGTVVVMNHAAANADQLAALKAGARDRSRSSTWALLVLLGALFVWSYQGSEIDLGMLFSADGGGAIADYVERLFPPDLSAKVVADAVRGRLGDPGHLVDRHAPVRGHRAVPGFFRLPEPRVRGTSLRDGVPAAPGPAAPYPRTWRPRPS